jgi:hypothetical protein
MNGADDFLDVVKAAARSALPQETLSDVVTGTVTQLTPRISITINGDTGAPVTETFLTLSPLCVEKTVTIPASTTSYVAQHDHTVPAQTITLWRGLQVGDTVLMLRFAQGGRYFVLCREGALT